MFDGIRTRGDLDGIKQDLNQQIGVDWQKLRDLRFSYQDRIKIEIDIAVDKICSNHNLRVR